MTAIDFATYFIARLLKADSSLIESGALCAIAAGADTKTDIAHSLSQPLGVIHNTLHRLTKKKLISPTPGAVDDFLLTYTLTPTGKNAVLNLINFLKH